MTSDEIESEINRLNPKKACIKNDIPCEMLINCKDIVSNYLSNIYNNSKNDQKYPISLKVADVTPLHKKNEKILLKKYRPVSLIPIVSKLFERNMLNQILSYINTFLSPYLFGYRKGYSTEQCLIIMIEMWKKALDQKSSGGAVLTDLSKAFDCLNHDLLIAKLEAYGFNICALKFIYNFLKERKQRSKVNGSYITWRTLKCGVPQGSVLGPLLFNIFINDIFFFIKKARIANYADDNTAYATGNNIEELLETLEIETSEILQWFKVNVMKSNDDKCHLFVTNEENVLINIGNETVESDNCIDLLGIKIDSKLHFNEHVSGLCKRGNQKLHALARISKYMDEKKIRIIMKTFIQSQFNYCPLTWMFHNRTLNNKINKLQERALRIVYKDDNSTFQELLDRDNSLTTHDRNLQKLAVEMYKTKNGLSPLPMQQLFTEQIHTHNLRKKNTWVVPSVKTNTYGKETIRYRGPKTWELLPTDIKNANSLQEFKLKIKKWKPEGCTCRLCRTYISNLGFIN